MEVVEVEEGEEGNCTTCFVLRGRIGRGGGRSTLPESKKC
jgi:hypothetical protein